MSASNHLYRADLEDFKQKKTGIESKSQNEKISIYQIITPAYHQPFGARPPMIYSPHHVLFGVRNL